jgi:hypothetical protein
VATPSRALLANLDVYFAEGNIRRGVTRFANNMLSRTDEGEFRERRLTLLKNTSQTFQSLTSNSATIIRCSQPVTLTTSITGNINSVVLRVKSLFVYTGELGDIIIANESLLLDSQIQIIQI